MALDALNPGPNNDYPNLPRNSDGTLDTRTMPVGQRIQRNSAGKKVLIDVTSTLPDGRPVTDIAPLPTT